MQWNWQLSDWPEFSFDAQRMASMEALFMRRAGELLGKYSHLSSGERSECRLESLSDEALKTSQIEGELLDRASVQSSLQLYFGLKPRNAAKAGVKEQGIAEVLANAWENHDATLNGRLICQWHASLMKGQLPDNVTGKYRTGEEPMRIVSGDPLDPEIHFEAPPAGRVASEMTKFNEWFQKTTPRGDTLVVPALTRAAIAHLRFETIHPFVDGNGRIGRVIAEKAIFQGVGAPLLLALSQTIHRKRREYYQALAETRFTNEITPWISWFGQTALDSAEYSLRRIDFLLAKTRFFDRFGKRLNARQTKVLNRMFREGSDGFTGGLSAGNYLSLTKTSPATARRDLGELVHLGAFTRTGDKKATRYYLQLEKL